MALYPPFTAAQLQRLNAHIYGILELKRELTDKGLATVECDADVDDLSLAIGQLRGSLQALDMHLFSTWNIIQRMREENYPGITTFPQAKRKFASADLAALLTETQKESTDDHPTSIDPTCGR